MYNEDNEEICSQCHEPLEDCVCDENEDFGEDE